MKKLQEFQEFVDSNPVWYPAPVQSEPSTTLNRWMVFEVEKGGVKSIHFVGDTFFLEGRVSSDIQKYDMATQTGTSMSGRLYQLDGPSGQSFSTDAEYTWKIWLNRMGEAKVKDVSRKYAK